MYDTKLIRQYIWKFLIAVLYEFALFVQEPIGI